MPEITRVGLDSHVGHASPTPNPFHQTAYATGSPDVYVNGAKVVRIGDTTSSAAASSFANTSFISGLAPHRLEFKKSTIYFPLPSSKSIS